jgi:hypothetical protein
MHIAINVEECSAILSIFLQSSGPVIKGLQATLILMLIYMYFSYKLIAGRTSIRNYIKPLRCNADLCCTPLKVQSVQLITGQ